MSPFGLSEIKRQATYLAAIGIVLLLIVAGWTSLSGYLKKATGDFLYPYLASARYSYDQLSNQTLLLFSRHELAGQLEAVRRENRRLSAQAAAAAELLVENGSLRKIAKLPPPPSWKYINSEIILRDPRFWNDRVTIDRGGMHGVTPGAAALAAAPDGQLFFVGVTDKVNRRTSEVITIYSNMLRMSAYLPLTGAVGVLNAADNSTAGKDGNVKIGFLPTGKNYTIDEVMLTTGFERQIPPGIKIGNLTSFNSFDTLFSGKLYQSGTFKPAATLSEIRFLIIAERDKSMDGEGEL